jgi:hypothetical protein
LNDKRPGGALPKLIALLLLALLLTMYGVGYFQLSTTVTAFVNVGGTPLVPANTTHRMFRHAWLTTFYAPAGELEASLRGAPVRLLAEGEVDFGGVKVNFTLDP